MGGSPSLLAVRCIAVLTMLGPMTAMTARAAEPVTFTFRPTVERAEPFAAELWAEVILPSERVLRLPAYYAGNGQFAVRARAEVAGKYQLGLVSEQAEGRFARVEVAVVGNRVQRVAKPAELPAVRTAAGRFVLATGEPYVPLGMNLAWATSADRAVWYRHNLHALAGAGLNWVRVWMANWGGLDLAWLPPDLGASPRPGDLDQRVAATWDQIVAAAEAEGVYLQVVLQHHGQYSSQVNPNWAGNPWNAANPGGFLRTAGEFFTSEEAARLTRQKFRYGVARWGYSPAVLAWELFNEVHWVDAIRIDHREAEVARWHRAMAGYVRSVDVYRHLVTTSTEDLRSPIYAAMDYLQPHLYATDMLAAVRRFDVAPTELDRPIFYGEMGDDHMRLEEAQKASGVELAPIAWASVMGEGCYPAQVWEGAKMLERGRLGELRALAEFLKQSGLPREDGLRPFAAVVSGVPETALVLEGAENWHQRPPVEITVAADGRLSLEQGVFPRIFVGAAVSVAAGYPDRATVHIEYPRAATVRVRIADAGAKGAAIRVRVDGETVAGHTWEPLPKGTKPEPRPAKVAFPVAAGPHTLVIDNPGGLDWFDLESIDFGLRAPVVAAIGRRSQRFIALWLWHREGVFALKPPVAVAGWLAIDDVPAGSWRVTWWDTLAGKPAAPATVRHAGGMLKLATPLIARHAAVMLTRSGDDPR